MRLFKRVGIVILAVAVSPIFLFGLVVSNVSPAFRCVFGRRESLLLTMEAHQYVVRMSGSINVRLTLKNLDLEEAELHYSSSHRMDLFLYSLDGGLVTYLTKDCLFAQVLTSIRLQPGESREWQISWNKFNHTGVTVADLYLLEGSVLYFETSKLPILILP